MRGRREGKIRRDGRGAICALAGAHQARRKRYERLARRKRFRAYSCKGSGPIVADREANLHFAAQVISLFPPSHRNRASQLRPIAACDRTAACSFLQRAPRGAREFSRTRTSYSVARQWRAPRQRRILTTIAIDREFMPPCALPGSVCG